MSMPSERGRRGTRPRTAIERSASALGVAIGLAVVGGSSWWLGRGDAAHKENLAPDQVATTGDTLIAEAPERVDVTRPRAGGLMRRTTQPGSVHAFESVDIFAKVSGFLKDQRVDIGDVVKRGELLGLIDVPELEKDVEEAAAAVEQARARAALAEARVTTSIAEREAVAATLVEAEADIAQHVAKRTLNEKQLDRTKGLFAQSAIPREVVDEQEQSLESARAAERSARAAAVTAKAQLATAEAKVEQARADVAEACAAIRLAEARHARSRVITGFSRIDAPFDGVITARYFHPGAFIRSAAEGSTDALLTVMRTDRMRVVVQVPDLDVAFLDVGDPATVVIDALKGRTFSGAVSRLARAENPTTRTMRVEIDLANPSGLLCEGMYGRATIDLHPPSGSLTLPSSCVLGHSATGQAKVYVVADGRVRSTSVTLGADDGTTTEVLSGLSPDDQVVLNPRGVPDEGTPVEANLVAPGDSAH
jgi:RND family efflux transporter MFP subunit